MNYYYEAFKNFFEPLVDAPCPKTEALIKAGVQQSNTGYISAAKAQHIPIDFTAASPSQGWHFKYYINNVDKNTARPTAIACIELLYWMCEVSSIFPDHTLEELAQTITSLNRSQAIKIIKPEYFSQVIKKVEAAYTAA